MCNTEGLPNLKLSLSAGAWQKLMVQRGSNRVPADVCKRCHQCMHTPHASSRSLSWINPKARKSLHAPVRLLHAPKRFAPSEMIWLEAWFEGISHSDWTELQTASLMKLMKEHALRYYEAVCMKQKFWFNSWKSRLSLPFFCADADSAVRVHAPGSVAMTPRMKSKPIPKKQKKKKRKRRTGLGTHRDDPNAFPLTERASGCY